mgnify:CR=1 FL=1
MESGGRPRLGDSQPARQPKERILRSNRLSTALHVGNVRRRTCVGHEQCQGLLSMLSLSLSLSLFFSETARSDLVTARFCILASSDAWLAALEAATGEKDATNAA